MDKPKYNYMENTNLKKQWEEFSKTLEADFISPGYSANEAVFNWLISLLEQEKIKWLEALPKEMRRYWKRTEQKPGDDEVAFVEGWNACLQTIKQQLTK